MSIHLDLPDFYSISLNEDFINAGKKIIKSIRQHLENGTQEQKRDAEPLELYDQEVEFAEIFGLLGYVSRHVNEPISMSPAANTTVFRHEFRKKLTPFSWAEMSMTAGDLHNSIRTLKSKMLSIIGDKPDEEQGPPPRPENTTIA